MELPDLEFSMPVDVQTYDKKDVDDLFVDLVRRLSITGVDAYVKEVLKDERMGVEAIQIRPSSGRGATGVLTSETLGFVPAELVHQFLNQYIKPVVTSPELQYLFPAVPGDGQASFGTLAMLLVESSKRVNNWQPLEINNMDHMIEMSAPLASFQATDKVIKKAASGSNEYRRLKVSMAGDSQFHQKVSAWAEVYFQAPRRAGSRQGWPGGHYSRGIPGAGHAEPADEARGCTETKVTAQQFTSVHSTIVLSRIILTGGCMHQCKTERSPGRGECKDGY